MEDLHQTLMGQDGAYAKWHKQSPLYKIAHWVLFMSVSLGLTLALTQQIKKSFSDLLAYRAQLNSASATGNKWVSGFYAGYLSSIYPPSAIDFSSITHVMMFSVLPNSNGTLDTTMYLDSVNGPKLAMDVASRAHAAGKVAVLTVGSEGTQTQFEGATSSANMSAFVNNIVTVANNWGYDGVDIDWEPLTAVDYPAFTSLVSKLRALMPGKIITTDVSWQNQNFPLNSTDSSFYSQVASMVDQMNIMTYGMADNWQGWVSWHSSALSGAGSNHPTSVQSSVQIYQNAGIPLSKLGMGIGFYGSCWDAPTTAPLQSLGTSSVVANDNSMSFASIKNNYYNSAYYHYDSTAQAPWLSYATAYGPNKCTFISYEDETSVAAKGNYANQVGLGGTIIWNLNEGYNPNASDPNSILHAVAKAFLGTSSGGGGSDTTAPSVPVNLQATSVSTSQINLTWGASTDDIGVTGYKVYRNGNLVASPAGTSYSDTGLAAGVTYTYAVSAFDAAGNNSAQSAPVSASTYGTDSTPPSVSITYPAANSVIAKKSALTITASASDNVGVAKVQFYVNTKLSCTDYAAPYSCGWRVPNSTGQVYSLQARAFDSSGNQSASAIVTVTSK